MKQLILTLVALCATAISLTAQTDSERIAMARDLLDKMSAKNKSYTTISVDFTVTIDNKQTQHKSDHPGQLLVKGDKYRLDIMNTTTYFDGTDVYAWSKDVNEVTVSLPDEADDTATPMKLFAAYETGYRMLYLNSITVDGRACGEVDLYPEDLSSPITRVRLVIDEASYVVKSLMQQGKDGTNFYVKVNKFKSGSAIADSEFVFNKAAHPEVEIIDMR